MKLHSYSNYEEYVAAQTEANKRKLKNVWVRPETIEAIVAHAPSKVHAIICHGTRNGAEQRLFKKHFPRALVVGTEISDTATLFEYTVQHDFHEQRSEWVGAFDIVYSNSWDHSYAPYIALAVWRDQLVAGGRLFIEHPEVTRSTAADPVEMSGEEVEKAIAKKGLKLLTSFPAFGIRNTAEHPSTVYVAERT